MPAKQISESLDSNLSSLKPWQYAILVEAEKNNIKVNVDSSTSLHEAYNKITEIKIKEIIAPDNVYCMDSDPARVGKLMSRLVARSHEKHLASMWEDASAGAKKYNIPYDKDICVYELLDLIEDYKELLKEACSCNIEWELSYYDPIALKQEIEHYQMMDRAEKNWKVSNYFSSLL